MGEEFQAELQDLGLLDNEAQIYLALIRNGPLGASAISSVIEVPRSSVYPTLNSLVDKGLVEGGTGYGSRFSAIPPEHALPSLVVREKEAILQREGLAKSLVDRLSALVTPVEPGPEDFIQVIRSPRGVADRFDRLQLEAEESIDVFVKGPFFINADNRDNPAQAKAARRGVRLRGLYERAILEVAVIGPYVAKWIAGGEEARVYEGELPHKLAIFDRQSVLVHLTMPGDQMRSLFIRHSELATSLGMLFDSLWDRSEPLSIESGKKAVNVAVPSARKLDESKRERTTGQTGNNGKTLASRRTKK